MATLDDILDAKMDKIINLRSEWIDLKIEIQETHNFFVNQEHTMTDQERTDTLVLISRLEAKKNHIGHRLESFIR